MNKTAINKIISNLKKANIVSKSTPWLHEDIRGQDAEVKYVGIRTPDFHEIFTDNNNILLKFIHNKQLSLLEYHLANTPPFIKITQTHLQDTDKWETLLGDLKRQLKKDKQDYIHHRGSHTNLYAKIATHLKS